MKILAITLTGLTALVYSGTARALGPVDIELAARSGYATSPTGTAFFGTNPYGFGLGGRAGVSFLGIYGGVSGMYYLGGTGAVPDGPSQSIHTAMEGFEVGYTLPIPFVKIRPEVGIGNATFSGTNERSSSNLYVEPGILVMVPLGIAFVGADINALVLPSVGRSGPNSDVYGSLSVHGQVGVRF